MQDKAQTPMKWRLKTHFLPPADVECFDADDIAVVADVLRATSVMVAALHAGASAIYPCLEVEEARSLAASKPGALLCGERQGLPIPHFDMGNSPGDYVESVCRDRELIMTTTNGTRAILSSVRCRDVYVLAFTNAAALFEKLHGTDRTIHLVCAGTDGLVSWEDTLVCGLLAGALIEAGHEPADDATLIATAACRDSLGGFRAGSGECRENLLEVLKRGRGGRRVQEIGLEKDIVEVARLDVFDILGRVVPDPWRIVRVGRNS
jgi:2-phosphosulfolactate phosphatase